MMIFPGEYIYSTDMMGVICRENLFSICMELHVKNIKIKNLYLNGEKITDMSKANISVGKFVENIILK